MSKKPVDLLKDIVRIRNWYLELKKEHPDIIAKWHEESIQHTIKQAQCTRAQAEQAYRGLLLVNDPDFVEPTFDEAFICACYFTFILEKHFKMNQ